MFTYERPEFFFARAVISTFDNQFLERLVALTDEELALMCPNTRGGRRVHCILGRIITFRVQVL